MKVIACIPSRYAAGRLPGKPLCEIDGKPLILHVVERTKQARNIDEVVVLTDDQRILQTVVEAGHQAQMTAATCRNGTERIIDYLRSTAEDAIIINVQGDELLVNPRHLEQLVDSFKREQTAAMATLAHLISDQQSMQDPAKVKLVVDEFNNALYFSRQCIPVSQTGELPETTLAHIGVYIYTRQTLEKFAKLPPTTAEITESLEQLRALGHGIKIKVLTVENYQSLEINTPADLAKAHALFANATRIT